ncbi:Chaperone protein DnaJ [Frankliniella fusca]|uniref:Chaperone protein DnaJ n=1 Tax=Frankliniella fusca TaxID=407009 RepID=A0AAE1GU67_9NEOP|nr:Chaperone protein DnaJ [Frankliniella fusca]
MAARALLLLVLVFALKTLGSGLEEPSAVDVARIKTIYLSQRLWKNVSNPHFTTMVRQETLESMINLINVLESLQDAINEVKVPSMEEKLHLIYRWERIQAHSYGVHSLFETFTSFMKGQQESQKPASKRFWLDVAETILQDQSSEKIHTLILNPVDKKEKNRTIFDAALEEHASNSCDNKQSTQLMLYNMYAGMQLTQLKSYIMGQSACAVLQIFENGDYEEKARQMNEVLVKKAQQQASAVLKTMRKASRTMMRCDPRHYKEHETYEQFTRLLQGYIENEVDMNPKQTCRGSCKSYEYTENFGCFEDKFCSQQPKCEGRIIDCQFIESDMKVCQSHPGEIRRYEYVEYKKSALLGTDRITHTTEANCTLVTVNSWWRFFLPAHCSYCFCLCDEPGPLSDRFVSLSPEIADVTNNKVITGLRFVKKNRVIYLQIQEGSLLPHGVINASSLHWKPVNESQNEYKMSWEKRDIDLDNLEAPEGHVLTGIRFQEVGTHLNMEIMVSPLIYHKGILKRPTELSYWIGNSNTDSALENPRSELILSSKNVPQETNGPCKLDSQHDSFLKFTHSDIVTDAAQTTVPYLDIQPVTLDPPTLLGGAGLYHKGSDSSSGFVALKVFNYDISKHVIANEIR